jgi:hypothetical protein
MPFLLRKLDDLAEERTQSPAQVKRYLDKLSIPSVGGYFDQGALEAVEAEPKCSNIKSASKDKFTIAPTDGIGAMKAILDKANVDIVRHLCRKANFLTVRNSHGHRQQVKVYCTQHARGEWKTATFSVRGFLRQEQADHFMFICFQGPIAWGMSRKQLIALHSKVKKSANASDVCRIPKGLAAHPTGALTLYLDPSQEAYLLTNQKQIGL